MKTHTKRLLSLVLAAIMIFAMIPANAMPAQAEGELAVDAYPRTVAVGQTSKIFTKVDGVVSEELTLTSSNPAVATVEGNVVTGVHSGTAIITATDANGATGTYEMVVSATSTYNFNSFSFNIGNDTDSDGIVDDFGGTKYEYMTGKFNTAPMFGENPYTNSVDHYIPYYIWGGDPTNGDKGNSVAGASPDAGYAQYRGRNGQVNTSPLYSYTGYIANSKYFDSYDYLNLNKTAPFKWASNKTYINSVYAFVGNRVLMNSNGAELGTGQTFSDRKVWITIELDVPAAGTYQMNIDAGTTGGVKQDYYMIPVSTSPGNNAAAMCNSAYYVASADLGAEVRVANATVTLEKGKYYFVINLDWVNTAATKKSPMGYIKSVDLTLEEWNDAVVNVDNTGLLVGGTSNISVSQASSFGKTSVPADLSFEVTGDAIHLQDNEDGTAKVTAIAEGTAAVTVSYTEKGKTVTKAIAFNVGKDVTFKILTSAFNIGNDTDADGIVDDFGDSATSASGLIPSHMYNNWTDKAAQKFVPFYATGNTNNSDTPSSNANASTNGYVWFRAREGYVRFYPMYGSYPKNEAYFTTYDYINSNVSGYWQWANITDGINPSQTYLTQGDSYFTYLAQVNEPYFVIKLMIPSSGDHNITFNNVSKSGADVNYYLIPASSNMSNVRGYFTQDNLLGTIGGNETTKTFSANIPSAGEYYLICNIKSTAGGIAHMSTIKFAPNVLSAAEITATGSNELGLGQQATLKVTQTGTISGEKILDAKFENSNPDAVSVAVVDGVATITAVDAGVANVTVTYTDLFGIERTAVYTYTVTKPVPLTYSFNSFSYKIGVNADGDAYADELGKLTTKPTWYDANDEMFIPAYYRYAGNSGVAYYPSNLGTNGYVYGDLANTGFYWFLSLALSTDSANRDYLYSYDYLDTNATAPFAFTSYSTYNYFLSSANPTVGTHLTQDYLRVNHNGNYPNFVFFDSNGVNNRTYPYITMKIKVAHAGTYAVDLVGGAPSVTSANYKVYMAPVNGTTVSDAARDLMKAEYYIGNLDNSVNESGRLQNTFEAPAAGEYYVCFQYAMDGENYNRTTGSMNSLLKSLTLTPVPADLDGYTVTQNAVLSDDIEMQFNVTATGSLIAGFDVFVNDTKIGNVPVETGVKKTIGVSLIASQMSQNIKLQAVDANGEAVGEPRTYSLREYLLAVMNGNFDETTKELAKNAYNYCAMAQIHANRDTDVIKDDVVEVTPAEPDEFKGTILAGSTEGIAAKTATLLIENKISIRIYFQLTAGESIKNFTFTYGDKVLEPVASGSRYYVEVDEINPQMYKENVVITVAKGGQSGLTVTYSAMAYIQRTYHNANTADKLKNLVMAMNGYHEAAVAYVLAHPNSVN